ncbi:MAG TPA: cytochrome c biogenesis protein CcsA [Pirellulaceae bacterium]|nr:cytochrome c biogenesis protein CcsA [Pirellulaceae bacterium]
MHFLSGITVFCFAASYGVTLLLEVSRMFFRVPVRFVIMLLFALAGLLAHTIYLVMQARESVPGGLPLSSWHEWCLLGAWVLAVVYVMLVARRPESAIGVFLLPLVEGLIGVGYLLRNVPDFQRSEALQYWGILHGVSLLLGTVAAILGFVAGLMYLVQSYRLKQKLAPRPGFKLPSLEWLQRFNESALMISSCLLLAGLGAGSIWNIIKQSAGVPWTDRAILISGVLGVWLIAALVFNGFYRPARQGRKVAYLTVASFVMLVLVLAIVLSSSQHAITKPAPAPAASRLTGATL